MAEINDNGLNELFAGGSYIRRLFIPKGIVIVSRIWKKERSWLIVSGEVTFTTEMGTQRVKAPYEAVIPAGAKKMVATGRYYIIQDSDGAVVALIENAG